MNARTAKPAPKSRFVPFKEHLHSVPWVNKLNPPKPTARARKRRRAA